MYMPKVVYNAYCVAKVFDPAVRVEFTNSAKNAGHFATQRGKVNFFIANNKVMLKNTTKTEAKRVLNIKI